MTIVKATLNTLSVREKVLGYPVDLVDKDSALSIIESSWQSGKALNVVTLNAEMVIAAQKDSNLDRIVRHANLIIADGAGVVFALKLEGQNIKRVPGIELAESVLSLAAKNNKRVALVGSRPEVVEALTKVLPERHPGLNIVISQHGYFTDDDQIMDQIREANPDLVLVALGVPRQEYFIDKFRSRVVVNSQEAANSAQAVNAVMIGVGGSFDVWTGNVKRAPAIMRQLNCEWLWRLLKEPWRAKRMASSLPYFAWQVIWQKLTGK